MFVRLSFESGQKINKEELKELAETLSDDIKFSELYYDSENKLTQFYSWQHTLDSHDPKLEKDEKGKSLTLLKSSDLVQLDDNKEYLAELNVFINKHPSLKIKIRGMVKTIERDFQNAIEEFQYVYKKIEDALQNFNKHIEFNEKCDVHIANLGLLSINQVGLIEDACTDALQDILNKGWRIITVCPQPDQRRPDYILGRYNPEQETGVNCVKF